MRGQASTGNKGGVTVETRITIPYVKKEEPRDYRASWGEVILEVDMAEGSSSPMQPSMRVRGLQVRLPECAAEKQDAPHYRTWMSLLDLGREANPEAKNTDEIMQDAEGFVRRIIKGDSAASAVLLDYVFSDLGIPPGTMVPCGNEGEKS